MAHFNFFKLERRIIFLISSLLILYLMMYINSSNALYTQSSSFYLSPSFTIFSISSLERLSFALVITSFFVIPVDNISAVTVWISSASISKISFTLETPLGAHGIPETLNFPQLMVICRSFSLTLIFIKVWLSLVVE
ncbi:hypothetical protein Hanom_Chr03g00252681 [Helianthus anomalus]